MIELSRVALVVLGLLHLRSKIGLGELVVVLETSRGFFNVYLGAKANQTVNCWQGAGKRGEAGVAGTRRPTAAGVARAI